MTDQVHRSRSQYVVTEEIAKTSRSLVVADTNRSSSRTSRCSSSRFELKNDS